jgi:hypothetical protein
MLPTGNAPQQKKTKNQRVIYPTHEPTHIHSTQPTLKKSFSENLTFFATLCKPTLHIMLIIHF